MIKLNEIRIGNLFTYCNNEDESPFNLSDFVSLNEYELSLEDIKPIRITLNRLYDLGFINKDNSNCGQSVYKNGVYIGLMGLKNDRFCFNAESTSNKSVYIEFIHELQNLYYDLTKEDLIK